MLVDLLVPMKPLTRAKTRLRGVAQGSSGVLDAHAGLVLALARDTFAAVAGAAVVRRVVAICSDEVVCGALAVDGVESILDEPAAGLNSALQYGEAVLRAADPATAVAALLADLPALRPQELDCAIRQGLATGDRAFCADRMGTGTTLLVTPPQHSLNPRFGPGSATAHRASGARDLSGRWPGLRCDVDTAADLRLARELGLGRFTRAVLHIQEAGISLPGEPVVYPCDIA
ncbi:MAG TPA: 2-phospho-L-lactate guanylyltransferase [Pseudonocardiaceae bacterium]|nr:2-phospho-L-lactate guanylyltransferase [Pseudonocardiaceae bacterium]